MIHGRTGVGSETSQGRSQGTVPERVTDQAMHLEVLQELALRLSGERSVDAVLQLLWMDSRGRVMSPSRASGSPGPETSAVRAECAPRAPMKRSAPAMGGTDTADRGWS